MKPNEPIAGAQPFRKPDPAFASAPVSCRPPVAASPRTGYFCPVCGHEFLPEEIGKEPHCRQCGYLES